MFCQDRDHDINIVSLDSLLNIKINSASKHWQKTDEAPSTVSIITSDEIEKYGFRTLDEALNSLAGFYTSYDRNYSYLGVRGFSRPTDYNDRILLLINEHPLNENIFGSSPTGSDLGMPMESIDRIEIIRGPGSSLYGTGAMFAVINIVTKTGKSFGKTSIKTGFGNLGRYTGNLNYGSYTQSGADIFVTAEYYKQYGVNLYYKQFDTDSTNHGIAANLDQEEYYDILASLSYNNLNVQAKFSNRIKYIPTAPYSVIFNDGRTKTMDGYNYINANYTIPFSETHKILFKTSLDNYLYSGVWPYTESLQHDESNGIWWTSSLQDSWSMSSSNLLISGIEFKKDLNAKYRIWDEYSTYFEMNNLNSVFSFFLQDELQIFKNLSLIGSFRFDNYSNMKGYLSPRAALVYNILPITTLKFIVGSSLRVPSPYELYYQDPISNFRQNPGLSPERIITSEFVVEQRFSKKIYSTISLYSYKVQNLIDQKLNTADSSLRFQNFSKVDAIGVDADINYSSQEGIRAYLRYSYQNAEEPSSDVVLSNSPAHLIKAGLILPINRTFNCATEIIYETNRLCVDGSETNSFMLVNLSLSTNKIFDHIKMQLKINNLFNTAYSYPGGYEHVQPYIMQDGRTYFFTADFDF
jgi:iron complex outermembrane receptor protein